uniref:Uncharacterized protein n=1 Tax=Pristionchus pacificus TaxID=54126 RepID=A0A2A6CXI6_PRIPA
KREQYSGLHSGIQSDNTLCSTPLPVCLFIDTMSLTIAKDAHNEMGYFGGLERTTFRDLP